MKSIFYAVFAVGLLSLASCSGDLEKRVIDLERRVAALEGSGSTPLTANPVVSDQKKATNLKKANEKPEGPLPSMEFEDITEGDVVTKVFKFTNTGEAPLIISNATSSCGCTVPSFTKAPIAPGEEGELEVKYNSRGKKNQDNKVVRVTANTWPATNNITIKAFVEPKADKTSAGPLKQ